MERTFTTTLSLEELRTEIKQSAKEAIIELGILAPKPKPKLWTREEFCMEYKCSSMTCYRWMQQGLIVAKEKINRRLYFDPENHRGPNANETFKKYQRG